MKIYFTLHGFSILNPTSCRLWIPTARGHRRKKAFYFNYYSKMLKMRDDLQSPMVFLTIVVAKRMGCAGAVCWSITKVQCFAVYAKKENRKKASGKRLNWRSGEINIPSLYYLKKFRSDQYFCHNFSTLNLLLKKKKQIYIYIYNNVKHLSLSRFHP